MKVVELESKLKQQEDNHSTTYQKKVIAIVTQPFSVRSWSRNFDFVTSVIFIAQVNDLEKKLREQMQQSESTSLALQQKVPSLVIALIIQFNPSMQYNLSKIRRPCLTNVSSLF